MTDDEKLERLFVEGVFDRELPAEYQEVVKALTPNEVEAISSITKRLNQVQGFLTEDRVYGPFTKF
jgi:hypothetical protein